MGSGVEEERAEPRARAPPRQGTGLVQERARRGAGRGPRRSHARRPGGIRRSHRPHPRRSARARPSVHRRGSRALDRGPVPRRRARDVPRPRSPLPPPLTPHMSATRAVIFDMDGVIVDSGAHHRQAWITLLGELGVTPPPGFWRRSIARPSVEPVPLLLGEPIGPAEARRLANRKHAHYETLAATGM